MSDPHPQLWPAMAATPHRPPVERHAVITGFDILRFVLGLIGLFLGASVVVALLLGPQLEQVRDFATADPVLALEVLAAFYLGLAGIVLFSVKWGRPSVWTPLKLDVGAGKWFVLGPVLAIVASLVLDLAAVHLYEHLTGSKLELDVDQFVRNGVNGPLMAGAMLAVAGVLGPIVEELIFRGLILGWLQRLMPFWAAAVISSILFGLAHVQGPHIILAGLLGLVFAYLYRRAGSLWAPIAGHIANNLLAVGSVYFGF